ncbi:acyl-CoA dehydrogenase family protein [Streptomyces sp. NRRL S-37]|uniref:acyl-CoA dehydrogenase family protein n=1 Tax=Streptomyces sp. NRRL S-37 TaxID=1463903 RepID=UPI001F31DC5A|nr:acyl-CoA dehydrogenase family protein [Streptomyces sp. NRRL S-37]
MNQRQICTGQGAQGGAPRARGQMGGAVASAAAHASAADATGRLSAETVALLTRAGFARHFVPGVWHGTEGTFSDLLAEVAAVGEGCASAAWCAALWATHGRYAAHLPLEGQLDLWGRSPDVRIAAGLRPSGSATRCSGGWLLSGTWECVSGVADADWLLLAAPEPDEPRLPGGRCRLFAVPAAEIHVQESWRSTGMRGTGSHTAVLDGPVVIPDHRTCSLSDVLAGSPGPGRSRCHTAPAHLGTGLLLCAPALGAARHALREWTVWAARRGAGRPTERATLQLTLAQSADDIEAAELLLGDAALRADSGTRAERDVARNRRVAAAAAQHLVTAVERLFRAAGTHACGGPGPLERTWRDVHVLAAHQALRRETAAALYADSVFADFEDRPEQAAGPADEPRFMAHSAPAEVVAGVH